MNFARIAFLSFLIFSTLFANVAFADEDTGAEASTSLEDTGAEAPTSLETALQGFCTMLYSIVGTLAFIMVVFSSIIFSAGQFFGAETRARMSVWANSMLIGAITGILMVILVPWFLGMLIGVTFCAGNCTFISSGSCPS